MHETYDVDLSVAPKSKQNKSANPKTIIRLRFLNKQQKKQRTKELEAPDVTEIFAESIIGHKGKINGGL